MFDVSIIIVNYNTCDLLRQSLGSVYRSYINKEVIVVDNASTDGSVRMVQDEFPEVRLILNNQNYRFAKPNNVAMLIACGRYIFLLNSDASLYPNALENLIEYADGNPKIGICAPQLLYPDGSIQPSCRGNFTMWTHFCDMFALDRLFPKSKIFSKSEMSYFDHNSTREVDHVMAAAIIVRRQVIEDVGMFDENLSFVYNDLDWSMRIRKKGWKIVFYPKAKVFHHHSMTTKMLNKKFELSNEIFSDHYFSASFLKFIKRLFYFESGK